MLMPPSSRLTEAYNSSLSLGNSQVLKHGVVQGGTSRLETH
jgi:hypothetical protein